MQLTPHRILQQYIPAKKLKWFTQDELKQLLNLSQLDSYESLDQEFLHEC